jgi:hypothetical protein
MTLAQARALLDILVDKANNPYFTSGEKDLFLELSISDFIEKYYAVYDINEQARAALKGLVVDFSSTTNTPNITVSDDVIFSLSLEVQYWHRNRLAVGTEARNKPFVKAKQVPVVDFRNKVDPFNKSSYNNPIYTYISSGTGVPEIHILPDDSIQTKEWSYLKRPTLAEIFTATAPMIEETYQHEVVQIAARKMLGNIESSNYEVQSQEAE